MRRKRGGQTFTEFSRKVGLSSSTLQRIEAMQQNTTVHTLQHIVNRFRCKGRRHFPGLALKLPRTSPLSEKSCAQSERPIIYEPARARASRGDRANGLTERIASESWADQEDQEHRHAACQRVSPCACRPTPQGRVPAGGGVGIIYSCASPFVSRSGCAVPI